MKGKVDRCLGADCKNQIRMLLREGKEGAVTGPGLVRAFGMGHRICFLSWLWLNGSL